MCVCQVPSDYDVVYIGSCLGRHAPSFPRGFVSQVNEHVYLMNQHRCASGYVLSRKGAEKVRRAHTCAQAHSRMRTGSHMDRAAAAAAVDRSNIAPHCTASTVADVCVSLSLSVLRLCVFGLFLVQLLRAPPMIGMDNIDEWMQFHMSLEFDRVYWLEPVLLYEGTKSFLLPVFCSPRTSWLGCDPFWRPFCQCVLLGIVAATSTMALLAYKSPRTWSMRLRRLRAFVCPLQLQEKPRERGRLSNSGLHPLHVHVHAPEAAD